MSLLGGLNESLTSASVDPLAQEIGVTEVSGVFVDHVGPVSNQPEERHRRRLDGAPRQSRGIKTGALHLQGEAFGASGRGHGGNDRKLSWRSTRAIPGPASE
ncbi:MAG TPA: hypothetical protein VIJ47_03675 [Acidimicrobiales bacterium]